MPHLMNEALKFVSAKLSVTRSNRSGRPVSELWIYLGRTVSAAMPMYMAYAADIAI
jgi:hypothetical protein